jgi:hypothetical protein
LAVVISLALVCTQVSWVQREQRRTFLGVTWSSYATEDEALIAISGIQFFGAVETRAMPETFVVFRQGYYHNDSSGRFVGKAFSVSEVLVLAPGALPFGAAVVVAVALVAVDARRGLLGDGAEAEGRRRDDGQMEAAPK